MNNPPSIMLPSSKPLGAAASTSLFLLSPHRPTFPRTTLSLRRLYHYSPGSSRQTATLVTGTFIGTCLGVYAYTQYARTQARPQNRNPVPLRFVEQNLIGSAQNLREGRYWTLLTYTFTHLDAGHLFFNMAGLFSFGRTVVILWGVPAFLALWVGAGVTGGLAGIVIQKRMGRGERGGGFLGASGSVLGLSAAVTCQLPRAKMFILPIPVPISGWIMMAGFAGWSVFAQNQGLESGTGHLGHLGGMAFGALYWLFRLRF